VAVAKKMHRTYSMVLERAEDIQALEPRLVAVVTYGMVEQDTMETLSYLYKFIY
jgi:hypothetical protein